MVGLVFILHTFIFKSFFSPGISEINQLKQEILMFTVSYIFPALRAEFSLKASSSSRQGIFRSMCIFLYKLITFLMVQLSASTI